MELAGEMTARQDLLWKFVDVPADRQHFQVLALTKQATSTPENVWLGCSEDCEAHQPALICEVAVTANQYIVCYALPEDLHT